MIATHRRQLHPLMGMHFLWMLMGVIVVMAVMVVMPTVMMAMHFLSLHRCHGQIYCQVICL
jgi:uncharacterized membrane protein